MRALKANPNQLMAVMTVASELDRRAIPAHRVFLPLRDFYTDGVAFRWLKALGALLVLPCSLIGQDLVWFRANVPNAPFTGVSCSSDGTRLVAVAYTGIWTSTNSGASWTSKDVEEASTSIASSSDGKYLVAATLNHGIHVSTNWGDTWTLTAAPTATKWISVSSSFDGRILLAVATGGCCPGVYISTNSGAMWTRTINDYRFHRVASSSDANVLFAAGRGPYVSTNLGSTWTTSNPFLGDAGAVCSSSDGKRLLLALGYSGPGSILSSTNLGLDWNNTSAPNRWWTSATSSADGTKLACVASYAGVYLSPDYGLTWELQNVPSTNWTSVCSSADGNQIVASFYDGGITGQNGGVYIGKPMSLAGGTPIIVNGFLVGVNITNAGWGYVSPPNVQFISATGRGAGGYAEVVKGLIATIVLTNAGYGYTSDTIVRVGPPAYPTMDIRMLAVPAQTVVPGARNLLVGQAYQLDTAAGLTSWAPFGPSFTATNSYWRSGLSWEVSLTNQLFFRLRMLP